MDFNATTDSGTTPSYPRMAGPSELSGGMNSGSVDPAVFSGAALESDGNSGKKPGLVLLVFIGIIGLMTAITIGFFMYLNSQGARADTSEADIAIDAVPGESQPQSRSTEGPPPTQVLPTIARSPTPTPIRVTTFPTPTIHKTDLNTALLSMTGTPGQARHKWEIVFPKGTYTSRDFSSSGTFSITGTLYTPIAKGKMVCTAPDQRFFNRKVSEKTIARLCDENTPTPVTRRLQCFPYDPATGIPVEAALFPGDACDDPAASVARGETYVMAVRVWYNCEGSQKAATVPESWCADSREVFSYDVTYSH